MAENALLKYVFTTRATVSGQDQFDLSAATRRTRMRQIMAIARKHGLPGSITPVQFRAMLEDLGPSFVKIGQTLSTHSDILPQPYCDELKKLQADSDPLPFDEVLAVLDEQYGAARRREVLAEIDPTPLGSASLAQVHRGRLVTGEDVAIKVQRPGVRETMALDIEIMRKLVGRLGRFIKDDQFVNLQDVVDEMWTTFLQETNFCQEASNLEEFARNNASCVYVAVPKVHKQYSNEYVLVMEYVDGVPISHAEELQARGYDLDEIGTKLLDNYASQVLDQGFFHADPHPGNILIRGGQIVYIDLGLVGRLGDSDRADFGAMVKAVGMRDSAGLSDALMRFAVKVDESKVNYPQFLEQLDSIIAKYASEDVSSIDIAAFLGEVLQVTRDSHVVLPSSVTNVSRGVITIEGTAAPYLKDQSIISIINRHVIESEDPLAEMKRLMEDTARGVVTSSRGLMQAATYSGQALKMLTRGQLRVNTEMIGSDNLFRGMSTIFTRVTLALIIMGLFIGSSMLALSPLEPKLLGVPALAFLGFAAAVVLSIWVLVSILRSGSKF
ncbi:MAG: AarF/ABC1/UbiB kinase family protein [Eggerthellaceae bacterium]|jgi:ubiquinone biosynthesis protein|nr:AarF/ABC1/UbiB kinase family protein [Eggerthellaceae bacterium]